MKKTNSKSGVGVDCFKGGSRKTTLIRKNLSIRDLNDVRAMIRSDRGKAW
jgi:hypothetical protein